MKSFKGKGICVLECTASALCLASPAMHTFSCSIKSFLLRPPYWFYLPKKAKILSQALAICCHFLYNEHIRFKPQRFKAVNCWRKGCFLWAGRRSFGSLSGYMWYLSLPLGWSVIGNLKLSPILPSADAAPVPGCLPCPMEPLISPPLCSLVTPGVPDGNTAYGVSSPVSAITWNSCERSPPMEPVSAATARKLSPRRVKIRW